MSGHPEDARDLCQEIFLRVHGTLGQFRFQSALSTWIGRVAFSVASNALQRKKIQLVEPGLTDEDPLSTIAGDGFPDMDLQRDQLRTSVLAAVDELSPLERTLITMYHLDELSIEEIANVVDAPQGTVKNYLFRARRRLREKLTRLREELA
jgi:RNA polymerase sigma-70 factor (ECF subfamily)